MDIDECNDQRFSADTLAYCGQYTNCNNNHGSYSCDCFTGTELVVGEKVDLKPQNQIRKGTRKQNTIRPDPVSVDQPRNKDATQRFVNRGVVYQKSYYKVNLPTI